MKKIIYGLIVLIAILTLTGCFNNTKSKARKYAESIIGHNDFTITNIGKSEEAGADGLHNLDRWIIKDRKSDCSFNVYYMRVSYGELNYKDEFYNDLQYRLIKDFIEKTPKKGNISVYIGGENPSSIYSSMTPSGDYYNAKQTLKCEFEDENGIEECYQNFLYYEKEIAKYNSKQESCKLNMFDRSYEKYSILGTNNYVITEKISKEEIEKVKNRFYGE